jgi:transposase-like protein
LVITLLVIGSVLPLLLLPITSFPGRVALAIAVGIALFVAMSIKRESDRIARRDEERASPRCRLCGRRYDEPLEAVTSETAKRCAECGRPSVGSGSAVGPEEA